LHPSEPVDHVGSYTNAYTSLVSKGDIIFPLR
jgi:hypothetical protein